MGRVMTDRYASSPKPGAIPCLSAQCNVFYSTQPGGFDTILRRKPLTFSRINDYSGTGKKDFREENGLQAGMSRRAFLVTGTALALSGCAVPRGAPTRSEVVKDADDEDAGFKLVIVSRKELPKYKGWGDRGASQRTGWPNGGATPSDQRIAPGDVLALRIWDAEETSLLSGGEAPFADVSNVTVTAAGHITLPYVDQINVGGVTRETARRRIQDAMIAITPSAQVQLEVREGRRNSVEMIGGVASPGTYPLTERNLPLSSMLAAAGGADSGLTNPQVQLTRGAHIYRRPLQFVLDNPKNDPPLQGADRIVIQSDPRSFTALGAANREEVIGFDAAEVSALRALSMMGGLSDTRADPRGLLVLRNYPRWDQAHPYTAPHKRVVFSFDLTHADGMFNADEFLLQDGDIVMATQAVATTTQRVLALMGGFIGFGRAASSL